jgi:succinate dehydrogenase hydrophobic anchor subunit
MNAFMLDMMVAMMPYMKPLLWLGVAAAGAALLLRLATLVAGRSGGLDAGVFWMSRVAGVLGVFFLLCQVMGMLLGATPAFNLADSAKFEFWMVPFWQAGLALLTASVITGYGMRR